MTASKKHTKDSFVHKVAHRVRLWFLPSYRRHRTTFQKQFDLKIQYMFLGCFLGILIVFACLVFIQHHKRALQGQADIFDDYAQQRDIALKVPEQETLQKPEIQTPEADFQINATDKKITSSELVLKKKETLSGLLKRADVSMAETIALANALDIVFDVRRLRAGQSFTLYFVEDEATFQGLSFETNKGETISVFKNVEGTFVPKAQEGVIEDKHFVFNGVIESTFSEAAQKVGIPNNIVHQVVLALDGLINFNKDLKTGEKFYVIYEQKMTQTGKSVGKSQLLYFSLTTRHATYQRYFFTDTMGYSGFYDENGKSTEQKILQRPLGRGRISSGFGNRKHPILGYQIQHKGIDFPAPLGTPVPAGADGKIERIGRNGGYGKYIKIKHNNTYSTAYGHLNDYQKDLKVGSYVKKGEIIGYVGNTGRSTGPHLHYEVIKNKVQVTPLKTYTIPQRELKNQTLAQFKKKKEKIDRLKASLSTSSAQ